MTGQGPFRVLEIPTGEAKDHDGMAVGDDHLVMLIDPLHEAFATLALTTDHVHTSEYGDLVPSTQVGLARLLADCLNRQFKALGFREWVRLVAQHDEPTHPPVNHPPAYPTCAMCHEPIVGSYGSQMRAPDGSRSHEFHAYHNTCAARLPGGMFGVSHVVR